MGWPATPSLTLCSHCSGLPSALQLCQAPSPAILPLMVPLPGISVKCSYSQLLVICKKSLLQEVSPSHPNPSLPLCFILFVVSTSAPKLSMSINFRLEKYKLLFLYPHSLQWYLACGRCSRNSSEWKDRGRKAGEGGNSGTGSSWSRN